MEHYIVRVELHGASYSDYENLHAHMKQAGFLQTIRGGNGIQYKLPTAEYYVFSSATLAVVKQAAKNASAATGKAFWLLATQAKAIDWELQPA